MQLAAPSLDLDADEADLRTAWIQSRLDAESAAAQRWFWIVLGGTSAVAVAQFVVGAAVTDTDARGQPLAPQDRLRPSMYVGGVTAAIGALAVAVFPFRPAFAANELRHVAAATPAERIARARRAEAILQDCAETEDIGRSWPLHAVGVVIGVVSSLVLWLGYQQGALTVIGNLVGSVAINELQVLTQPTRLIDEWSTYRRARWRPLALEAPARRPSIHIAPMAFPGGAGLTVTF